MPQQVANFNCTATIRPTNGTYRDALVVTYLRGYPDGAGRQQFIQSLGNVNIVQYSIQEIYGDVEGAVGKVQLALKIKCHVDALRRRREM